MSDPVTAHELLQPLRYLDRGYIDEVVTAPHCRKKGFEICRAGDYRELRVSVDPTNPTFIIVHAFVHAELTKGKLYRVKCIFGPDGIISMECVCLARYIGANVAGIKGCSTNLLSGMAFLLASISVASYTPVMPSKPL